MSVAADRHGTRRIRVADTDVHHGFWDKSALYPYLSGAHRARFEEYGVGGGGGSYAFNGGSQGYREDVFGHGATKRPKDGGVNVPDPDMCRRDLLDGAGVDVAILGGGGLEMAATSALDIPFATAVIRAFNDFSVNEWLTADPRFRLAIAINPRDPRAAAEEIDRLAGHPQVVSVIMPCGATSPYGQAVYEPIHEACERNDLAITIHFGLEGAGANPPPTSAGWPSHYIEGRLMRPAYYQVHLASLVFEGVFERHPGLKVGMIETGLTWIPSFLWRMDQNWQALRWQVPWVKRPPSEYVSEHVRFSSQPIDEPAPKGGLTAHLEWLDAARTVMFSSDYPHFDWDDPQQTFGSLDPTLKERIFWSNAAELYGLDG